MLDLDICIPSLQKSGRWEVTFGAWNQELADSIVMWEHVVAHMSLLSGSSSSPNDLRMTDPTNAMPFER